MQAKLSLGPLSRACGMVLLACLAAGSCGPPASEAVARETMAAPSSCRTYPDRIDPSLLVDAPKAEGPFTSHVNDAWRPGVELIEIRWLPVAELGGLHEMLVYTTKAGDMRVIAGFPEDDFDPLLRTGTLVMQISDFEPTGRFTEDLSSSSMREVVARGEDLSGAWTTLQTLARMIDRLGMDYFLGGPNSNSAIATLQKYSGLPRSPVEAPDDVGSSWDLFRTADERELGCTDGVDAVDQVLK